MPSMLTPTGTTRAVTSSPGDASAKPSTSNPQATFDTVAGANAVTSVMGSLILPGKPHVAYRWRIVGIRYSLNARSKSYAGLNPQSVRAAESSRSAGHESTMR